MWLRTIFRRRPSAPATRTPLDEQFLRRLERLTLLTSRGLRGGLSGAHPSIRRLPAPTLTDHRPYTTGDDVRYVDWNAYARLDHLQLKLGEAEQDVRVHWLLDCSTSMDWGIGDTNKLHYAEMLLAAVGYIALASGDRLQILPFGGGQTPPWGPASGRQRAGSLLQYIQHLPAGGTGTINAALQHVARETRGGLLVIASDLLHAGDLLGNSTAPLSLFHPPRWQVLLLHVLHTEELQPTLSGDVELVDSETGVRMSLNAGKQSFDQYTAAVEGWCDGIAQGCRRRGITYARLTTDMALEQAALPYLRMREAIR